MNLEINKLKSKINVIFIIKKIDFFVHLCTIIVWGDFFEEIFLRDVLVWLAKNHIYNALTNSLHRRRRFSYLFSLLAHTQNCTFHEFFMRRNWKKNSSCYSLGSESGYLKQIFATWIIYSMSIAYLLKVFLLTFPSSFMEINWKKYFLGVGGSI